MGVAKNDGGKVGGAGIQIQLGQIVQHVNRNSIQLKNVSGRKVTSPPLTIHVAADGSNRGYAGKLSQDRGVSHIARMDDVVRAAQSGNRLGTQEAMGVRDDADRVFPRLGSWSATLIRLGRWHIFLQENVEVFGEV